MRCDVRGLWLAMSRVEAVPLGMSFASMVSMAAMFTEMRGLSVIERKQRCGAAEQKIEKLPLRNSQLFQAEILP